MRPRGLVRTAALAMAVSTVASGAVTSAVDGATAAAVDGRVLISPVAVSLEIAPTNALAGQPVAARAAVSNIGPSTISRVSVRLRVASGLVVRGRQPQSIRRLAPGASASVSWSVCGLSPGSYLVFAEATFGSIVVDSPARVLTIHPGPGRCSGSPR